MSDLICSDDTVSGLSILGGSLEIVNTVKE